MLKTNYAIPLQFKTNRFLSSLMKPMKRIYKPLTHIFVVLCLVWAAVACNSAATKDAEKGDDKTKTPEKGKEPIPSTLENFDLTYYGMFNGQRTQMNLRRYGSALSGQWWMAENKEVSLSGSLQNNSNQFVLEVTNQKGEKIGDIHGKLNENDNLETIWKSQKGDSLAVNFAPTARNVKVFHIKLDDLKLNKVSQNGKRKINIIYPQILGIEDTEVSKRVNGMLDTYFNSGTWADSLEKSVKDFKEDVTYDVTRLTNDMISVCKHHHLDKTDGNTLFDDSHGITINFKRGKIYELRDIFKPNAVEALNKMLLGRINKLCGGNLNESALEKCRLKGDETTSFSLGKDKLTFHLTERLPYESRGCGYLRIEYKELREYINPSGPLVDYLNDKPAKK